MTAPDAAEPTTSNGDSLSAIADEIRNCQRCPLHQTRGNAVPGEGSAQAAIMLIGEGPGEQEDQQGRPFVGPSGNLLTDTLQAAGLPRERIFLTNTVKCRTPNNRNPEPHEIAACRPYLERQIKALNPALIVLAGAVATNQFIPKVQISKVRGIVRPVNGRLMYPILHPAAILRNRHWKPLLEKDLAALPELQEICRLPPPAV